MRPQRSFHFRSRTMSFFHPFQNIKIYLKITLVLGAATVLLTSCVSVDQQAAFQSVQNEVSTQTGMHVVWNQGTTDDQKAEAAVRQILAKPLNAESAVQIALLNNP